MENSIQTILDYNEPNFNYVKLAEELAELSEVVLKRYIKKEKNKPPLYKIVEEAGDVILKLRILSRMEDISDDINKRVLFKTEKLLGYIKEGKYKGGV